MRWFRYYSEALHDPKIQRLNGNDFKAWVNLLCIANETEPRGSLPDDLDISFALRVPKPAATKLVSKFIEFGLLDRDEHVRRVVVHNWAKWQPSSDDAAERIRNRRRTSTEHVPNKNRTSAEHVRARVEVDQNRTDPETEGEEEESKNRLTPGESYANIFRLFEQCFGRSASAMERQTMLEMEEAFDLECITHSFREAADLNKKSLRYISTICERHKREGCFVDRPESRIGFHEAGAAATDRLTASIIERRPVLE